MRICITGHIASEDVAHLLSPQDVHCLPTGYTGAPLMGLLIEALLERGHEVIGITTDGKLAATAPLRFSRGAFQYIVVPARPRSFMPQGGKLGRAVDMFRLERQMLVQEMVAARPDIVHAHWTYEFAWAALQSKLPHLITAHDSPIRIARYTGTAYRWVRAAMAWHVLRHTKYCTAVSPYMANEIQAWVPSKISVVPNPIAAQAFALYRERTPGTFRVALVCNGFGPHKNGKKALQAFSQLRLHHPQAELWVWGQDFGPGQLAENWARAEDLEKGVRFLGAVPHGQLLEQMSQTDVLLHPSLEESFGVVIAEAMAMGLPVVAGKNSGAVPWVLGDTGVLVDVEDVAAMSDALQSLMQSPQRTEALIPKAQKNAQLRFSLAGVVAQYMAIYEQIVESRKAAELGGAAGQSNG